MDKTIQVLEFDKIVAGDSYKRLENKKAVAIPEKEFDYLKAFIMDFEQFGDNCDCDCDEALDFFKIGYSKEYKDTITVKNYVGIIQLDDGYRIEILPKVTVGDGDKLDKIKEIFLEMLKRLDEFPCKQFNTADLQTDFMDIYEIFIGMFVNEVRKLVKQGLKSAYIHREDNLHYYKGKLLVGQHIRQNLVHQERFYVAYDEYDLNRPVNRLIKTALEKLQKMTRNQENSRHIRQLLGAFELVDSSTNIRKDFAQMTIDRTMKHYEILMKWVKIFLFNQSFTSFSGHNQAIALLFPMHKVYESYVAQELKRVLAPQGWDVSTQDTGKYLFDNPGRFSLRPDIVIRKDNATIIMDTKWKQLINDPDKNYGISQSDMYQMYAYSKKYSTDKCNNPEVCVLYPKTNGFSEKWQDMYSENECDDGVRVKISFVDLGSWTSGNGADEWCNNFFTLQIHNILMANTPHASGVLATETCRFWNH